MNSSGDTASSNSGGSGSGRNNNNNNNNSNTERPCGITSLLGMSCRGRAETFARRLESRLRTLGSSQANNNNGSSTTSGGGSSTTETTINCITNNNNNTGNNNNDNDDFDGDGQLTENTWLQNNTKKNHITNLQPLRQLSSEAAADLFYDFDIETDQLESPGSPINECEYQRLINETSTSASTTVSTPQHQQSQHPEQHDDIFTESGYVCSSPISASSPTPTTATTATSTSAKSNAAIPSGIMNNNITGSHHDDDSQSSDGQYFDPDTSEIGEKSLSLSFDYYDCIDSSNKKDVQQIIQNGKNNQLEMANGYDSIDHKTIINDDIDEVDNNNKNAALLHNTQDSGLSSDSAGGGGVGCCLYTDSDSYSESLPNSQSTSISTCTGLNSSSSNSTLQQEMLNGNDDDDDGDDCADDDRFNNLSQIGASSTVDCISLNPAPAPPAIDEIDNKLKLNLSNGLTLNTNWSETETDDPILARNMAIDDMLKEILPVNVDVDGDVDENIKIKPHTDDDEELAQPQRIRRCSSLKSGKTPPGTPGRKKIVRFADVFGLDLIDVRTFLDDIPNIPKSAYEDLDVPQTDDSYDEQRHMEMMGLRPAKMLMPMFQQPGGLPQFLDLVREKQVCLENAAVTDQISLTISGCVRVRNLDFHKSVHIRYSLDGWRSFADLQATYVDNSCDGFSDKFRFIMFGNSLQIGQQLEIAVRFSCRGQQFWDNNFGTNYCFQCLPTVTSTTVNIPATTTTQQQHQSQHNSSYAEDTLCNTFY